MNAPSGEIWFLASCVELYKDKKGLSGRDAFDYLRKTGAVKYIINYWEGLHMTGPDYIVDCIDDYIQSRNEVGVL